MMHELFAVATRGYGRIHVQLSGQLPNPSYLAEVVDKYPGGNRVYVVDPGAAQVFIAEKQKDVTTPIPEIIVPWFAELDIWDQTHSQLQVFINEQRELTVEVCRATEQYIVYALTGGINPNGHCIIVPEGQLVMSIYSREFGPASLEECDEWKLKNCPK